MKKTNVLTVLILSVASLAFGQAPAQQPPANTRERVATPSNDADNTRVNQRDRQPGAKTAEKQKENKADLKITQQIRKSLMDDKSLSAYAKNIKIITENGAVTLKGPVRTPDEKKIVVEKAGAVAGVAGAVTDEITVAP